MAWALLLQGLEDAREHLDEMITQMTTEQEYGEPEFRIDLGHVFAHLNRAWHSRNQASEITDQQWADFSRFPTDLDPVG